MLDTKSFSDFIMLEYGLSLVGDIKTEGGFHYLGSTDDKKGKKPFRYCVHLDDPPNIYYNDLKRGFRGTWGTNQQKALKFHWLLANLLSRKAYRRFSISQILAAFRCGFLRTYNPMESIIFSSEKSYSPCKLKWLHRMTESFRMASMSSFLRSSLLSLTSSFVR